MEAVKMDIILNTSGVEEILKEIEEENKTIEKLKAKITADNKEVVIEALQVVLSIVMKNAGTLVTDDGECVAENIMDGQDVMDAICYVIEEVKNGGKNVY